MPDALARQTRTLYDEAELEAVLDAMAREVASRLAGQPRPVVVGILRRGVPLAERLAARLRADARLDLPPVIALKIERYADDLRLLHPETRLTENPAHASLELSGRTVLLVDDVLYHGHSLLRAVQWLERRGPAQVRVAMLADRCVTRLPVCADVVGLRLQVAPDDVIECHVPPYEPDFSIRLVRPAP